jgi:indolepyruvate ferredoxin oxidoreductase beta subunit
MSELKPVKIAILGMGGDGGAALAAWLADAAERGGFLVQATPECGIAERGGAAMYYVELFPKALAAGRGKAPVLGLTPLRGEVDIVIASELMEAGRAIARGLVTPDRTVLIASTHRVYTMAEKTAPSDSRADRQALLAACRNAAQSFVGFDMAAAAAETRCSASAVLLGATAASGALPVPAAHIEEAIRDGSADADAALAGFAAGIAGANGDAPAAPLSSPLPAPRLPAALVAEVERHACGEALPLVLAGLARTADYQDADYAALYWRRLLPFAKLAGDGGGAECELLAVAARQLALAMTYSDVIRVAELKLRASRIERIRAGFGLARGEILELAEYMHPRVEEVVDTMPTGLGRRVFNSAIGRAVLRRLTAQGRLVRTTSLRGFLMLYFVASLKPWRRASLRFERETERLEEWLDTVWGAAKRDMRLAVSLARARGLLRGYGETLERGFRKYEAIREFVQGSRFSVPASSVNALIAAAQAEEGTGALEAALAKLKSEPQPKVGHFSPAK